MLRALVVVSVVGVLGFGTAPTALTEPLRPVPGVSGFGRVTGPPLPASPPFREDAVRAATSYLRAGAYSRQGLIDRLEYAGYSPVDALTAVDHVGVDWDQQAVRAAKSYLQAKATSRTNLVDQLVYVGFTPGQASLGASGAGL